MDTPYRDLSDEAKDVILNGTHGRRITIHYSSKRTRRSTFTHPFEGLIENVQERYKYSSSQEVKEDYESFMTYTPCKVCGGKRQSAIVRPLWLPWAHCPVPSRCRCS